MPPFITSSETSDWIFGAPSAPGGFDNGLTKAVAKLNPFSKSIQKSYRFIVTFMPEYVSSNQSRKRALQEIGKMPSIRSWHLKSIGLPGYTYGKDFQQYGPLPRSFPTLKHDGFEVRMGFEEDQNGTIGNLINFLSRLPIDAETGLYRAPNAVKIPLIQVLTESDFGVPIGIYTLHDAFYLTSSTLDLDYETNKAVSYEITFNVDIINSYFPVANQINKLTSALSIF